MFLISFGDVSDSPSAVTHQQSGAAIVPNHSILIALIWIACVSVVGFLLIGQLVLVESQDSLPTDCQNQPTAKINRLPKSTDWQNHRKQGTRCRFERLEIRRAGKARHIDESLAAATRGETTLADVFPGELVLQLIGPAGDIADAFGQLPMVEAVGQQDIHHHKFYLSIPFVNP